MTQIKSANHQNSIPSNNSSNQGFLNKNVRQFLANGMLGFAALLGGFVIFEPAPYELFLVLALFIWILGGMRFSRYIAPLLFLFTLFNFGGVISSFQIEDYGRGLLYVTVSYFLALTSVFFASVVLENPDRLRIIFRGYVIGAVITTILGLIGYFGIIGSFEIFTRYTRLMGAFQDPNVYGPYLVVPILYLVYGVLNRTDYLTLPRIGALLILISGLFLAFSRAAWGLSLITGMIFYALLVINEQSAKKRLKYIVLAILGIVTLVLLLIVALQFDSVSLLFAERFKVVQDYDGGQMGRFARHLLGYQFALSNPLGIGPLEFATYFYQDTHNNYVKALMAYGWIGFFSWMVILFWTLIGGFKLLFKQREWLPYYQICYVVFLGHCIIGNVIDTDHWRHYYFALGIVWGCMAVEKKFQYDNYIAAKKLKDDLKKTPTAIALKDNLASDTITAPATLNPLPLLG